MDQILGQLMLFAGNFPPKGWAFCDGSILPISRNTALFSLLGTVYGGDGKSTFALPDLRGRVCTAMGDGPGLTSRDQGDMYGSNSMQLTLANIPPHLHALSGTAGMGATSSDNEDSDSPAGNYLRATPNVFTYAGSGNGQMGNTPLDVTLQNTGTGAPFALEQPSLGINYCIALEGVFPQRP